MALGFADGPAHFCRAGSAHDYDLRVLSIHRAALLTTTEEDRRGLRIVRWEPFA